MTSYYVYDTDTIWLAHPSALHCTAVRAVVSHSFGSNYFYTSVKRDEKVLFRGSCNHHVHTELSAAAGGDARLRRRRIGSGADYFAAAVAIIYPVPGPVKYI